ncbi:uncharacterized protein LOC134829146 [Culicoides brevitarsis]|uniref:uncharacterized protein LOC134829146 n=1 Tax=Culicoides brevitarsis TaxID=469753 RepID=UPI00307C109D
MQFNALIANFSATLNDYLLLASEKLRVLRPIVHDSVDFIHENIIRHLQDPEKPLFTEFQYTLLKTLFVLLLVNLLFILFFWRKYGPVITDKFIRPSTLKEIEELKLSVARLKLPKDYTPRI